MLTDIVGCRGIPHLLVQGSPLALYCSRRAVGVTNPKIILRVDLME